MACYTARHGRRIATSDGDHLPDSGVVAARPARTPHRLARITKG
jgi:hypothetical protein